LTLGRRDPSGWLWVAFILGPDPEGEHLTVFKSGFALYVDPDRDRMMLHYDYEREPAHSHPPAHVQVHGTARDLSALSEPLGAEIWRAQGSERLPLTGERTPVPAEHQGRRRVHHRRREDLADARPGWRDAIADSRSRWEDRQVRAAVRRIPGPALYQLRRDEIIPSPGRPVTRPVLDRPGLRLAGL